MKTFRQFQNALSQKHCVRVIVPLSEATSLYSSVWRLDSCITKEQKMVNKYDARTFRAVSLASSSFLKEKTIWHCGLNWYLFTKQTHLCYLFSLSFWHMDQFELMSVFAMLALRLKNATELSASEIS